MRNYLKPCPSEIVMTAILDLKQERGTSLVDIVRYAKSKYGVSEDNLKRRIAAALRRGVKYDILMYKNGLYHLNESVCNVPLINETKSRTPVKEQDKHQKSKEVVNSKSSVKSVNSAVSTKEVGKNTAGSRCSVKKSSEKTGSFLCPDCRNLVNADTSGSKSSEGYELKPRKTPSQTEEKVNPQPVATTAGSSPKPTEKSRIPWKDYLKMKISFRGRRRTKDKK